MLTYLILHYLFFNYNLLIKNNNNDNSNNLKHLGYFVFHRN